MKKNSFLILILSLFFMNSCKSISKLTQFEISESSTFTIPAALGINTPFSLPTPDIESSFEEKVESNQSNKKLIDKLLLKSMSLNITKPDDRTFSFIKHIDLYIVSDGLPKILMASKHDIPNSIGRVIDLDVEDTDFKEYIKADAFSITSDITTDEVFSEEVDIRIDMKFWVDAKILGF